MMVNGADSARVQSTLGHLGHLGSDMVNSASVRSTVVKLVKLGQTINTGLGRPRCSILLISYARQHLDNRKT
ncbi:hypothetical protein HanXRQr2_Chr11g0492101 [Helianthus annuus]|uniref:Uncharacterized protein n=1 Tax=Helianthus annuus TaxID=4232 RepID=A0A251ULX0_HELAN|nr:hypothetical protein HanXRQr2_Chr11g0492101 [Helianthus annuus]KAJ0875272.1 hypothetical protein HanPSC8_Chr11g0474221 [Helianthus annuus]